MTFASLLLEAHVLPQVKRKDHSIQQHKLRRRGRRKKAVSAPRSPSPARSPEVGPCPKAVEGQVGRLVSIPEHVKQGLETGEATS